MTKEGSTKTVNFMIPGPGVLKLVRSHISYMYMMKMHYTFKKSSTLLLGIDKAN